MKIAAAQFTSVAGDIEANVRQMEGLIRAAGERGARVIVFAELATTGYEPTLIQKDPGLWLAEDDARLEPLREACRAASTAAVVNGAVRTREGRPGITTLVIGPDGGLLARYDKVNLHGFEHEVFAAGTEEGRFALDGVHFALATCYDNRFPGIAERAAADGCRVYLASSVLNTENDSFEKVYPVRARDNALYVVLGNAVGRSEEGECRGGSAVWGPDGTVLADAGTEAPALAVAELPL